MIVKSTSGSNDGNNFTIGDSNGDIWARKVNSSGTDVWSSPGYVRCDYNGQPDYARGAAQTETANLFVVGSTRHATKGLNWLVLRIGSGQLLWSAVYNNAAANKNDQAEDVVLDSSDNIYVAGWSTNADDTIDLTLQKYGKDSNTPAWTPVRYSGHPASIAAPKPVHVGVDSAGYVYLAGTVADPPSTTGHMVVIKYNSNGQQQGSWSITDGESQLRDLAVDGAGNCYVTGYIVDPLQNGGYAVMLTAKVSNGDASTCEEGPLPGAGNHAVYGQNVAFDASGNVLATGSFPNLDGAEFIVKFDGNVSPPTPLSELWRNSCGGMGEPSLAVGSNDYAVVADYASDDYVISRWSPDGAAAGYYTFSGQANGVDRPQGVGVDASGNIYVTGYSYNGLDYDIVTLQYAP